MTRRDYEHAALVVQSEGANDPTTHAKLVDAFARYFRSCDFARRFDEARFRRACVPGANVRARG